LLDGLIESVFRRDGIVRDVEGNGVITEHAVSHSDFSGERLQRIEALVGIVDGCLQLARMLLYGFQLMAHCIVVARLSRAFANKNRTPITMVSMPTTARAATLTRA